MYQASPTIAPTIALVQSWCKYLARRSPAVVPGPRSTTDLINVDLSATGDYWLQGPPAYSPH
ncbi:hypothetical protein PIIN_09465 [Serendipita indica DSM 11827]|uniref:Uncharacterized protein n=1 Tax=Serendipita indica (strain DSM 11827) TaxID=1109443 RepID=G4TVY9_SERID|nr:hypothetical protein PIIN_09465 [Serendipita indica DSM 11827]